MLNGNSLESVWISILDKVWDSGKEVISVNEEMQEIQNLSFTYSNPFLNDLKKYKTHVPGGFIEKIAKIYEKGGEGWEGKNYANYIYDAHGVDQIDRVIDTLRRDPLSKSAIVFLSDGSNCKSPCVVLLNFSIRNKQLDMNIIFKSSDVVKKFIPDMLALSKIHKNISNELHIGRGCVSGLIFSAQLYSNDKTILKDILEDNIISDGFENESVIKNWDIAAQGWLKALINESHYVNFEDGYNRFTKHLIEIANKYLSDKTFKVLDLGSGTGHISEILKAYVEHCDILDISPKMLSYATEVPGEVFLSNALDVPVKDSYYDFVASRGVLISHVGPTNAEKLLAEINRILKKDGLLYLDYITKFDEDEIRHKKNKNTFSSKELASLASRFGFTVVVHFDNDSFRVTSTLLKKI